MTELKHSSDALYSKELLALMSNTDKGILILVISTFVFATQDAITKLLTDSVSPLQFIGSRYLVFLIFALLWACRKYTLKDVFRVKHPVLQTIRGFLLATEMMIFAYTLQHVGVGAMHAIFASFPLLVTAMSPFILKEKVGWRRWTAVSIGFIGTVIIIAPGSLDFTIYSLWAISCAVIFALYNVLTRYVSEQDSTESSLVYTALVGAIMFTIPALMQWQPITYTQTTWIGLLCALGVISHFLLILALKYAPAATLQPFNYFTLPWAILIGYVAFSEQLELNQLIGAFIVVASGVYIALRQRKLKESDAKAFSDTSEKITHLSK